MPRVLPCRHRLLPSKLVFESRFLVSVVHHKHLSLKMVFKSTYLASVVCHGHYQINGPQEYTLGTRCSYWVPLNEWSSRVRPPLPLSIAGIETAVRCAQTLNSMTFQEFFIGALRALIPWYLIQLVTLLPSILYTSGSWLAWLRPRGRPWSDNSSIALQA
jgi:hypothetical protein